MDYMKGRRLVGFVVVILSSVPSVTCQRTPVLTSTASDRNLLGTNVSLKCQYTLVDEIALRVDLERGVNGNFVSLVSLLFFPSDALPIWNNPGVQSRSELTLTETLPSPYATLTISKLVCTDEAQYRCLFTVRTLASGPNTTSSPSLDFKVNGKAQLPVLTFTPSTIVENQPVTFTCRGNVGRPRGILSMSLHDTSNAIQPVVLTVQDRGVIEATDTCTYESTIDVSLNFTANQKTMVVICKVEQDYVDSGNQQTQTETLIVQYFPRDTQIHIGESIRARSQEEVTDGSNVKLTCTTNSNPAATFQWSYKRDGDNETVEHAPGDGVLQLNPISMDQAGEYHCNATLVINNITYSDQQSISLIVNEKPTTLFPPSTTPSTGSTGPSGTTKDGQIKQNSDDDIGLIVGLVVAGVVVVALIIFLVCFIMRRKSKGNEEFEEPPNKPRNNQDLRTVVHQPDLVTNGEKINNYNNKGYEKNEDQLYYADLAFDDKPRSRRPVQILSEPGGGGTDYAEIAMPRV